MRTPTTPRQILLNRAKLKLSEMLDAHIAKHKQAKKRKGNRKHSPTVATA